MARALPHAEGQEGARRLSHGRRLLPRSHAALTDVKIEIVEVPFEGSSLPGYFVHAQNAKSARTPCVVFFDGLDVTKEIQFVARRAGSRSSAAFRCLVMDGPGTGEAIRFRGHPPAARLREGRQRLHRFPGEARGRRSEEDRHRRHQSRRLLRAALRFDRAALCRLHRLGRDLGLPRDWKRRIDAQFKASLSVPGHTSCGSWAPGRSKRR